MCAVSEARRDYVRLGGLTCILFRAWDTTGWPRFRHTFTAKDVFNGPHAAVNAPTMFMRVGRRESLRAVVGLLGLLVADPAFLFGDPRSEAKLEGWLRHVGAASLGDSAELSRIGRVYLDANPGERSRRQLAQWLSGGGETPIAPALLENIARNWADHDVVVVDGWVMARTEARICAVLHLMRGAGA